MDRSPFESSREEHPIVGTILGGRYAVDRLLHRGRRNDLFVGQETVDDAPRSLVLKVPHELSNASAEVLAGQHTHALDYTKGDKTHAARALGIGRKTLYRKLDQYNGDRSGE